MLCETVEFQHPVCTGTIAEAVQRLVDDGNPRTWFKHVRDTRRGSHRIGRAGKHTAYHLQVAPSVGNRWFSSGRHHGHRSIDVIGRIWHGRIVTRPRYEETLHRYYVNQFASQLAQELNGAVRLPYVEQSVLFCAVCQQQAEYCENYERMSCPSHGTRTKLIGVDVRVPRLPR